MIKRLPAIFLLMFGAAVWADFNAGLSGLYDSNVYNDYTAISDFLLRLDVRGKHKVFAAPKHKPFLAYDLTFKKYINTTTEDNVKVRVAAEPFFVLRNSVLKYGLEGSYLYYLYNSALNELHGSVPLEYRYDFDALSLYASLKAAYFLYDQLDEDRLELHLFPRVSWDPVLNLTIDLTLNYQPGFFTEMTELKADFTDSGTAVTSHKLFPLLGLSYYLTPYMKIKGGYQFTLMRSNRAYAVPEKSDSTVYLHIPRYEDFLGHAVSGGVEVLFLKRIFLNIKGECVSRNYDNRTAFDGDAAMTNERVSEMILGTNIDLRFIIVSNCHISLSGGYYNDISNDYYLNGSSIEGGLKLEWVF